MRIQFHCFHEAKTYYDVVGGGEAMFCGTRGECRRFIALHNEKVRRSASMIAYRARGGSKQTRRYGQANVGISDASIED
jgi:hypothetical protein